MQQNVRREYLEQHIDQQQQQQQSINRAERVSQRERPDADEMAGIHSTEGGGEQIEYQLKLWMLSLKMLVKQQVEEKPFSALPLEEENFASSQRILQQVGASKLLCSSHNKEKNQDNPCTCPHHHITFFSNVLQFFFFCGTDQQSRGLLKSLG